MSTTLPPGSRVDRYRIEVPLGEGGMATVYQVRHEVLGTVHALKVLHVHAPRIRDRLLSEGRAQAQLAHPNIVAVTDVLQVDQAPALLMEFVDGGTLADALEAGPLPLASARRLFRGVVAGVAAAHDADIIHRDLKPENVLLSWPEDDDDTDPETPDWGRMVPKVTDFGLAKMVHETLGIADPSGRRTEAGVAMGTPAFMAPEQIRDARTVDHRADIFSLGALFYAMLTGHSPFDGPDRFAILQRVTTGRHAPVQARRPEISEAVATIVARCLSVEPADRYPTARALLADLDGLSDTTDPPGPRSAHRSPPMPPTRPLPRSPAMPSADGTTTASVAGLVVDRSGRGHVVELVVVLTPGASGVRTPADVDRDANVAAQLAAAVALGPRADDYGVRWAARGVGFTIHGTSLGLAIAIATRAALLRRPGPSDWAFTGGIDLDGQIVSVHGVPAKVRAAAEAGLTQVVVPKGEHAGLRVPDGVTLHEVGHVSDIAPRLLPRRRRAFPWRWALLGLPVALAITDATSALDTWIQHPVLAATRTVVEVEDVVLVSVPYSPTLKERRSEYPALFHNLQRGGATGVFFDIALSATSPHDAAIAAAITEVSEAGMSVGIPVRMQDERPVLPGSPAIQEAATLGVVEARQDAIFLQVRSVPARMRDLDGGTWWHLAVWTAAAHVHAQVPPSLANDVLQIGPLRNPTVADELVLPPIGPVPTIPIDLVAAAVEADQFRGKSVVVGVIGAPNDSHRLPSGVRSGAEIEAGVVQVLIRQAGVDRVAPEWDALFAALLGIGTFLLGSLSRPRTWLASLVPIAGGAIFLALASANQVLAPGPAIIALVVAFTLLRREGRPRP